jgi:uncharacterized protein
MKFICDTMLGKLAKYLRIAGIDASYSNTYSFTQVISEAAAELRILLTRRTEHLQSEQPVKSYFIASDYPLEQLQDVFRHFSLQADSSSFFTRCLECNQLLESVEKETVAGSVPPYVFSTASEFVRCPHCNKIYWKGTHYGNMLKRLQKVLGVIKEETC